MIARRTRSSISEHEDEQAQPLPQLDLEEVALEEDRRQPLAQPPVAELFVKVGDLLHGLRRELPDVGAVAARHPVEGDFDTAASALDDADEVPPARQPVVAVTLRFFAQPVDIDPQLAVEDRLQLAREDRSLLRTPALRNGAEVQVVRRAVVIAFATGDQVAARRAARGAAVELVRGARGPGGGRLRGRLFSGRGGAGSDEQRDRGERRRDRSPRGGSGCGSDVCAGFHRLSPPFSWGQILSTRSTDGPRVSKKNRMI
jgi:hypothetical protein